MKQSCTSLALALVLSAVLGARASGQEGMQTVTDWDRPAAGIWRARLGNTDAVLRYTDLAAAPPKVEAIEALPAVAFPFEEGAIRYLVTPDHKLVVRVPCAPDESLYGFGLQLDGAKKSRTVMLLNVDHWGTGGGRSHAPVPFYVSSKGYGVFFDTARFLKAYNQLGNRKDSPDNPPEVDRNPPPDERDQQPGRWQAVPRSNAVEAQINGEGLELVVFGGRSMLEVVQRYNLYCGGGALPPLWGLGFWHRVHAHFDAEQTLAEIEQFEERGFPLEVIGLEPGWQSKSYPCTFEWQKKRFPDPAAFTRDLLDRGLRLNLWENPYISKQSRLYERMYPLSGSHLVWLGLVPDYTLPEARQLLTQQHAEDHIAIGVSGYKIDEVDGYDCWLWPDHATFPSGVSGETMRQAYGLLMQNMLYQDLFRQRNVRTYGLVRGSNGAASGYPFVLYSDAYRHAEYITGLSTASLCGVLWTPEARSAKSGREWLNRIQTVCFSPMAKVNGWASGMKPWSFEEVTDAVRDVIELRMRLSPYLYSAFAAYHFEGIPAMRAMILEDGSLAGGERLAESVLDGERNPYAVAQLIERNDQFMFGPSIMVAPFYEAQALERYVRLPAGNWYDFYTGQRVGNDETITVTAAALGDRMPLFVREGAVVPLLTRAVKNTRGARGHPLEVRHYGRTAGSFDLYEDDGLSFDYERGEYRLRRLHVDEQGVLTVEVLVDEAPALFGEITSVRQMSVD